MIKKSDEKPRMKMESSRILAAAASAMLAVALSSCAGSDSQPAPSTAAAPTASAAKVPCAPVSLSQYYNAQGIYPDGAQFSASGGADGDGFACSSNLLSTVQWNGAPFQLGTEIAGPNVVTCHGQTISIAQPGHFSKLAMLGIAVNGAQADQNFTVTYTDNSTQSYTQSLSDWAQPDDNQGELQAVFMDYRDQSDGTKDESSYYLYSYSFKLDPAKTVQSLKLPDNDNVKVFALTLVP